MSSFSTSPLVRGTALIIGVLAIALVAVILVTAVGGGAGGGPAPTATASQTTATPRASIQEARLAEADDDPSLPGEYVDLPALYGGAYGERPGTAAHVQHAMDYASEQGLPPAGGPHWGSAQCGNDPKQAPPFCGPAPWGIYREPWPAETLVHNMEHGGVVVWYNTSDRDVRDQLEDYVAAELQEGHLFVLAPYPDMADESVAITVWSRRDVMAADELELERLRTFVEALYGRFNPEQFPLEN